MADVGAVASINRVHTSSQTTASNFEPSKPILPRMLALHLSLGKTGDKASHNVLDSLERKQVELQLWSKQEMDHLLVVANRTWMEHAWSSLKTVADCVISIASFVMGGYFLAHGDTTTGNTLIAVGVFNILQTVFARQGMWDWITETIAEKHEAYRERLKMALPIIVATLSIAFSIASSKFAANTAPIDVAKMVLQIQGAISVIAQGGNGYLSIKKGYDNAQLPAIQGELKKHEQSIDLFSRLLEIFMRETKQIKSSIKKPINALMQATTLASQKV